MLKQSIKDIPIECCNDRWPLTHAEVDRSIKIIKQPALLRLSMEFEAGAWAPRPPPIKVKKPYAVRDHSSLSNSVQQWHEKLAPGSRARRPSKSRSRSRWATKTENLVINYSKGLYWQREAGSWAPRLPPIQVTRWFW